jgi:hypothetical protein
MIISDQTDYLKTVAEEIDKRSPAPHMRTIRPSCIGQLSPVGLLVRLWSTSERLQVCGYTSILLIPVGGYGD